MADFIYESAGQITISGCASPTALSRYFPYKFNIGSAVYVKRTTERCGKLEKVVIKKVNMVGSIFNYVDTLNEVYLEEELLWESEVVPLAIAYWQLILTESIASRCN